MSSGREISKVEKEKQKYVQEKCQSLLNDMLRDEDNKYCVDCDAKGPRWASWNLGIFLCIRCAGIHRNLGVHISRVKSVNLDTWTPEQVVTMQQMGNSRARAVYEANLPDSFRRPQTDLALENFIRAKYESHKYIAQEWVKPPPPKVNWDAEIEESLKKKKDKKAVQNDIGTLPTAIPKPKPASSSPATVTKLSNPVKKPVPKSPDLTEVTQCNPSDDLLGLVTGVAPPTNLSPSSDPFASPAKVPSAADTNNQEDLGSIFTADLSFDPSQGQKMTKESILSLYGQAPSNNVNPFASQGGMFSSTATASNPFPQMAPSYNSNAMGQGQPQNSFANLQNNLLNGSGGGSNMFNPDPSQQIQQQMFGLNLTNSQQQQPGMVGGMGSYGVGGPGMGGGGGQPQQGFPQLNNPMGFNPMNVPSKGFVPGQTNFGGYQGSGSSNLGGVNNSGGGGNGNQLIFPKDGPIAATNLWK